MVERSLILIMYKFVVQQTLICSVREPRRKGLLWAEGGSLEDAHNSVLLESSQRAWWLTSTLVVL